MKQEIPPESTSEIHHFQKRLLHELDDGLQHGFFEVTITCELISGRKRRLKLKVGKTYQFVVSLQQRVDRHRWDSEVEIDKRVQDHR